MVYAYFECATSVKLIYLVLQSVGWRSAFIGVVLLLAGYLIRLERFKMNNFVLILLLSSSLFPLNFSFAPFCHSSSQCRYPWYGSVSVLALAWLGLAWFHHTALLCIFHRAEVLCASDLCCIQMNVYVMMSLKCYVTIQLQVYSIDICKLF